MADLRALFQFAPMRLRREPHRNDSDRRHADQVNAQPATARCPSIATSPRQSVGPLRPTAARRAGSRAMRRCSGLACRTTRTGTPPAGHTSPRERSSRSRWRAIRRRMIAVSISQKNGNANDGEEDRAAEVDRPPANAIGEAAEERGRDQMNRAADQHADRERSRAWQSEVLRGVAQTEDGEECNSRRSRPCERPWPGVRCAGAGEAPPAIGNPRRRLLGQGTARTAGFP